MSRGRKVLVGWIIVTAFVPLLFVVFKKGAPLTERELATRVLAEHVRKKVSPKIAVVISNPYSQRSGMPAEVYAFEKAGVAGLRKGFGRDVEVRVAFPKLNPDAAKGGGSVYIDPNSKTPLSFLVADDAFDQLVREHNTADVFVSLIGVPVNTAATPFWNNPSPKFALLLPDLRLIGDPGVVVRAFKTGKIVAAVIARPDWSGENRSVSRDYKTEFEKRFVLVTSENVEQHLPTLLR